MTGSPAALEAALADGIAEAKSGDRLAPVAVLIGGTLMRPYLQRRLADLSGAIANVFFLTPAEFALRLGERSMLLAGRLPLPPLADRILLRQIATDHEGYFEPVRDTPGLASALHRLVRELRGAGYDAKALETAIAGACEVDAKAEAINQLFSEFLKRRGDFYGPDDCLLEADPAEAPWTHVFTHGLWEVSPAMRSALAATSERIPLTVLLPTTGTHADDAHQEMRDWTKGLGADAVELAGSKPESGLGTVRQQLFSPASDPVPYDGTVRLLSAPDPTREVREVARACVGWAREGIRFHEMAIAYRNPEPYRAAIESVFAEAHIPVYLHEGTPLAERPLGRRALTMLDLAESRLERRLVMDFLSDLVLPEPVFEEFSKPRIGLWDRLSRDAGVVRGIEQWEARLTAHAKSLREDDREWRKRDAAPTEELLAFVRDFDRRLKAAPTNAPWSEHITHLKDLFTRYIRDTQKIFDALDGLERFDALEETVSARRFRDTVRATIENLRSGDGQEGAFGLRGVNVLDVNSLRHLGFKAVAIVGLVERSFPPPPRPDPILLDPERERLNAAGPAPLPLRVMGADPEPLQFAVAVAAAQERLLASFPRKGAGSGRVQLPSSLFRALAEAATGERVSAQDVDQKLPLELYTHARGSQIGVSNTDHALSREEWDRSLIEHDRSLGQALLIADEPRLASAFAAQRARAGRNLSVFDGVLGELAPAHLETLGFKDRTWSPTGLELYAKCPQQFFLSNVLGAGKTEEPEDVTQLSALHRGSLLHVVLQRFLGESPDKGDERLHGDGEPERLLSILDEEANGFEQRGETGYPLLWTYAREELREDLLHWLDRERTDPEWQTLTEGDYEVRFRRWAGGGLEGELSSDDPLEIEGDGVTLRVGGKIDRLNWDPAKTRFRVVDYKTGKFRGKKDGQLMGGRALQLPLYVRAAARALGMREESGSAEYHFSTRKGQFQRTTYSGEDVANRREDFEHVLAEIVDGIAQGRYQMEPEKEWDCKWCDFNRLCPANRFSQIARKSDDPVALRFAEMRDVE